MSCRIISTSGRGQHVIAVERLGGIDKATLSWATGDSVADYRRRASRVDGD